MSLYSPSIEKLIESFERLPSIGHKTAARLAFYMLNCSEEETNEFVSSIINAKKNLKYIIHLRFFLCIRQPYLWDLFQQSHKNPLLN